MKHMIRTAALVVALLLIAHAPAMAADKGDWAGGWTSWADAVKGDWAEYSSASGIKTRWDVLDVKGGQVTTKYTTYDAAGKETSKKEKTQGWESIKLLMRMPHTTVKVKWTEETLDLSGTELKCDVASYVQGTTSTVAYYCEDVPCGGFVKSVMDGKDNWWLSAYKSAEGGEVKKDPKDEPKVEPVKTELPRFYATPGNSVLIKISGTGRDASYKLREVLNVTETETKYFELMCNSEGTPDEKANRTDTTLTKVDWDKAYAKPSDKGVKLKVGEEEFVCDVYKTVDGTKETTEWISEGAPIKKVIKSGEKETVLEVIKITIK